MAVQYDIEATGEVIAGDTYVYRLTRHGQRWPQYHVWFDATLDTCRCTECCGLVSAMLTTCPHARAVRRHINHQRSSAMTHEEQLPLPLPPRTRVRLGSEDIPAERSHWETFEDPWTPGWWEVMGLGSGKTEGRWWFGGVWWVRGDPKDAVASRLDGKMFRARYAWRGLREPSPDIYPCPPYSSGVLLPAAQRAGVALRTMHAVITRPARRRVRIDQE